MSLVNHVVRRGLDHAGGMGMVKRAVQSISDGNGKKVELDVPTWGIVVLAVTVIASFIFMSLVEYCLKHVVATLAMVETPSAAITVSAAEESVPLTDSKKDLESELETGPTITLVHRKPITSSIRGTLRHLKAEGSGRLRGFKLHMLYMLCFGFIANILEAILPRVPGKSLVIAAATGALLANLHAAWTQTVISTRTTQKLRERIPSRAAWKLLAGPAAIKAAAGYACIYIAHGFALLLSIQPVHGSGSSGHPSGKDAVSVVLRVLAVVLATVAAALFITLPAIVTQTRIEASLLPEENDTVVPFDRTFAGKVVPKILGGTGAVGFIDAWKSFNWEARRRIVKLYLKIGLVVVGMLVVFVHVLALEGYLVMGPAVGKALAQIKAQRQA